MNRKLYGKLVLALFALALVFASNAPFATAEQTTTTAAQPAKPAVATTLPAYTIEVGDEFDVKSYYNPELDEHVTVRPDGKIALPIVNELYVAGLTPDQVANELTQRYASEFKQPQVSVILRTFANQKVYVTGQVNKPGLVNIVGTLTALQAISVAEGFKDDASETQIIVIRRGPDSRPVAAEVNLKAAIKGEDFSQDVMLKPYDIVFVPRSRIANVNRFVQNFIKNNIPVPFTFAYRLDSSTLP